jgi:mannosyltransferase OCH1-like enzyme
MPRGAERIIHQIWMQGFDEAPEYVRSNSRVIREMHPHPEWEYMFWNAPQIERLVERSAEWREKYATYTLMHQRVDFAKLVILYTFGGIIVDADAYTIRPLDSLFDETVGADLVASNMRRVPLPFGWVQNFFICGFAEKCLNNGTYIAKARSHALAYMIRGLMRIPSCTCGMSYQCIQQTTGPSVFHALLHEYARGAAHGTVVVLESEVLEPCLGSVCEITDRTYIVHKHEMTWMGALMTTLMRAYLACPHFYHALFLFALIAIMTRLLPTGFGAFGRSGVRADLR